MKYPADIGALLRLINMLWLRSNFSAASREPVVPLVQIHGKNIAIVSKLTMVNVFFGLSIFWLVAVESIMFKHPVLAILGGFRPN